MAATRVDAALRRLADESRKRPAVPRGYDDRQSAEQLYWRATIARRLARHEQPGSSRDVGAWLRVLGPGLGVFALSQLVLFTMVRWLGAVPDHGLPTEFVLGATLVAGLVVPAFVALLAVELTGSR